MTTPMMRTSSHWQTAVLLTPERVSDRFRGFIERHGFKKIRFHDLRHSCATLLLHEGYTLQEIQAYLGHATFQTTLRYAHLDATSKIAASNCMEHLLGNGKNNANQQAMQADGKCSGA